jgi:hypothetical protein
VSDQIEIGDKVTVKFASGDSFRGVVKYKPTAIGDAWHIRQIDYRDDPTPVLHYVQTYEEITRQQ